MASGSIKVFISWSGVRSKSFAGFLAKWLPYIIQSVKPFISVEIDKGARWAAEISRELSECRFGIVCITPENQLEPWLNFEAGAISAALDRRMVPIVIDMAKTDLRNPLAMHNAADTTKGELLRVLRAINEITTNPITNESLETLFDKFLPEFEAALAEAIALPVENVPPPTRGLDDKIDEILSILRNNQPPYIDASSSALPYTYPGAVGTVMNGLLAGLLDGGSYPGGGGLYAQAGREIIRKQIQDALHDGTKSEE